MMERSEIIRRQSVLTAPRECCLVSRCGPLRPANPDHIRKVRLRDRFGEEVTDSRRRAVLLPRRVSVQHNLGHVSTGASSWLMRQWTPLEPCVNRGDRDRRARCRALT